MDSYLELSPDSSAPHTPSPPSSFDLDEMNNSPQSFHDSSASKLHQDAQDPARIIDSYSYDHEEGINNSHNPFWSNSADALAVPQRGPYLSELYDDRMKLEVSNPPGTQRDHSSIWSQTQCPDPIPDPSQYYRRTSYPLVRNDHSDQISQHQSFIPQEPGSFLGPYSNRSDAFYGEPMPMGDHLPLSADPSSLHGHHLEEHYLSSASASPHSSIHEFDALDSAHSSPVIVPTQTPFYRPNSSTALHASYMNPHTSLPVMHTDDAASKETQYLRRRCFNCHTTEPPSWRRSTLNPGKIVCNKCGLYERTHLRPRPHRFDELRAGSKARKAAAKVATSPNTSPKPKIDGIKSEPTEGDQAKYSSRIPRELGSVTSVGSNGVSDWESGSAYSNSSAPNSGYNSPMGSSFATPLPHSRPSSREGPIRLPTAPLTDIATRLSKVPPAKSSSAPYYIEGRSTTLGRPMPSSMDIYPRRTTLPVDMTLDAPRLAPTLGLAQILSA
ncbi:hypothetical protein Clacol_001536 [Clathrus columnatus]|uniref:GATA-type domain-containing protein n=1 Tax=Clathrus columnatus TaxID=1419009 RepID=A0AAV4ZZH4_9AGAM|nr:hypothetical protein Clacol_001536 [Clathrus columnatus]